MPILLEYLGPEEYGFIVFATLVQGYANILDAGLSPAISAEMARKGRSRSQTIELIKIVTLLACKKFFKYSPVFLSALILIASVTTNVTEGSLTRLIPLCLILLIDAFILAIFRIQYAAMQGLGSHSYANLLHAVNIIARAICAVFFAIYYGIVEYIYLSQLLISLISLLVCFGYYWKRTYDVNIHSNKIEYNADKFKQATTELTIIAILLALINSFPYLVLSTLGEAVEVNTFFLALSLGGVLTVFQGGFVSIMIPNISSLISKNTEIEMARAYEVIGLRVAHVSFFIAGFVYCFANEIIGLWIGSSIIDLVLLSDLFRWQVLASAFSSLTIIPYAVSIPKGKTKVQLYGVLLYLIGCIAVLPAARFYGDINSYAMASCFLAISFSVGYFVISSVKITKLFLLPLLIGTLTVPVVTTLVAIYLTSQIETSTSSINYFLGIIIKTLIYFMPFAVTFYLIRLKSDGQPFS